MNQSVKNIFATLCVTLILVASSGCTAITNKVSQGNASTEEDTGDDDSMNDDDTSFPAIYQDDVYMETYGKK